MFLVVLLIQLAPPSSSFCSSSFVLLAEKHCGTSQSNVGDKEMSSLLTIVQDADESLMCCRKRREFDIYIVRPSPIPKWWRCKWVDIPELLKPSSWSRGRRLPLPPSPASAFGLGCLRISQRPNRLASTRPRRAQRPINRRSEHLSLLSSPIPCLDVTFSRAGPAP